MSLFAASATAQSNAQTSVQKPESSSVPPATRSRRRGLSQRKPVRKSRLALPEVNSVPDKQAPENDSANKAPVSASGEVPSESTSTEKSETLTEAPKETANTNSTPESETRTDPKQTLRDQIEAAVNPVERTRLRLQLVELMVADGKRQDATNELRGIVFGEHFDPPGFYNAGNALARLGDTDGAIAAYRKAIDQRKGRYSRALNNLGVVLLRHGRWDESYEALVSALRLENFRYAEASYNLGRLYFARGERDLAVREWRRAVAVNADHKDALQALSAAGEQGRISVASAIKPPTHKASSEAKSEPLGREMPSSRPAKAIEAMTSSKPLSVDAETYDYLQRARTAGERGRNEDALTNYHRVISRMGGYFAPANLELGYALINLKRIDEAIAMLTPVATRDGQRYPISYYHLARLYESRGDLQLAEEHFSRAATHYRSENAQFLLDVSRLREKRGDFQGALSALEEYLAILEQKNIRPDWSAARVASLKQRVAAVGTKP